jgi:hypothetical protein
LVFGKSRGTTVGSSTVVQSGDLLGMVVFAGGDGTDILSQAATIEGRVDGTPGSNDMPGRLVFSTTAGGTSLPTERLRIANTGAFGLSGTNYGSSGQVLTSNGSGSAPSWQAASSGAGNVVAWANFQGTGTVSLRSSGNISSVTDNGTGDYTVSFTSSLSSNYTWALNARNNDNNASSQSFVGVTANCETPSNSSFRMSAVTPVNNTKQDHEYIVCTFVR